MLMLTSRAAGLGAAPPAITGLQNALIGLAQASGRPAIHPGTADGILGPKTMMAVTAGLQTAAEKIPKDSVVTAVSLALALGSTSSQAIAAVNNYASQLTTLIRAATAAYVSGLIKPPTGSVPPGIDPQMAALIAAGSGAQFYQQGAGANAGAGILVATPWYKTWWGMGGIAAFGALALYILLAPKKETATAAAA